MSSFVNVCAAWGVDVATVSDFATTVVAVSTPARPSTTSSRASCPTVTGCVRFSVLNPCSANPDRVFAGRKAREHVVAVRGRRGRAGALQGARLDRHEDAGKTLALVRDASAEGRARHALGDGRPRRRGEKDENEVKRRGVRVGACTSSLAARRPADSADSRLDPPRWGGPESLSTTLGRAPAGRAGRLAAGDGDRPAPGGSGIPERQTAAPDRRGRRRGISSVTERPGALRPRRPDPALVESVPPVREDLRSRPASARAEVAVPVEVLVDHLEPTVRGRAREKRPERDVAAVIGRPDDGALLPVVKDGLGAGLAGGGVANGPEAPAVEVDVAHAPDNRIPAPRTACDGTNAGCGGTKGATRWTGETARASRPPGGCGARTRRRSGAGSPAPGGRCRSAARRSRRPTATRCFLDHADAPVPDRRAAASDPPRARGKLALRLRAGPPRARSRRRSPAVGPELPLLRARSSRPLDDSSRTSGRASITPARRRISTSSSGRSPRATGGPSSRRASRSAETSSSSGSASIPASGSSPRRRRFRSRTTSRQATATWRPFRPRSTCARS